MELHIKERERISKLFSDPQPYCKACSRSHNPCGLQISLQLGNASFQTPKVRGILQSVPWKVDQQFESQLAKKQHIIF